MQQQAVEHTPASKSGRHAKKAKIQWFLTLGHLKLSGAISGAPVAKAMIKVKFHQNFLLNQNALA